MGLTVNKKVVIDNKYYGTISHIEPPNEDTGFSGRFTVYCPIPRREFYFWFSDYGKSVISCK